jgi:hypothetical protein
MEAFWHPTSKIQIQNPRTSTTKMKHETMSISQNSRRIR